MKAWVLSIRAHRSTHIVASGCRDDECRLLRRELGCRIRSTIEMQLRLFKVDFISDLLVSINSQKAWPCEPGARMLLSGSFVLFGVLGLPAEKIGDIDVYVLRPDYAQVRTCLMENGFRLTHSSPSQLSSKDVAWRTFRYRRLYHSVFPDQVKDLVYRETKGSTVEADVPSTYVVPNSLCQPASPLISKAFFSYVWTTMRRCHVHRHRGTCRKGKAGGFRCRLSMPRGLTSKTEPVQLSEDDDGNVTASRTIAIKGQDFDIPSMPASWVGF